MDLQSILDIVQELRNWTPILTKEKGDNATEEGDKQEKYPELLNELEERLQPLQRLFTLQQENLSLQSEIRGLREKIAQYEQQERNRSEYEEKQIGKGMVVIKKGTDGPWFCLSCYDKDVRATLNELPISVRALASHSCSSCKATYQLK